MARVSRRVDSELLLQPERTEASSAFETFFRMEYPRLKQAMYVVTGRDGEAEEAVQEAFLKLWERWHRVRGMDDPVGYLYRVAMNAWRTRFRRARTAGRVMVRAERPEDEFSRIDDREGVARAMRGLTIRQRSALVLTEFLGFSSDEAGRILGVRPTTVRNLAMQGRAALKAALEGGDG